METIHERAQAYCKSVNTESKEALHGYIMGAVDQEEIDAIKILKALKAFCRCECDAKLLECPHKEQGGCAKYKKFKSII